MSAEVRPRARAPVVLVETVRHSARSSAVWGALFGLLAMNEALGYRTNFPTLESRLTAVKVGANGGLTAVVGPGRELDTLGGWLAWRVFGLLITVGAIWGLLAATRMLRREEDAGRWDVYLAGRTDRRRATAHAVAGLAIAFVVLWSVTAVCMLVAASNSKVDFSASAALFYATALTASAAMFLSIGAVTSQLGSTRRQANALAASVFGAAYVIRMVADSVRGLAWLRWASPLGWVENTRPLTGSQPLALLPIAALVVACVVAAILLAGQRDVGTGLLARHSDGVQHTRLLQGPMLLTVRLERWVGLAWVIGLGLLALIFGITAATVGSQRGGAETVEQAVGRLGVQATGVTAWIGYEFIYVAALVAFAAAGQVSSLRAEEADGHVETLIGRTVSRTTWIAGRACWGVAVLVAIGLATGVGGWVGLLTGTSQVSLTAMLQAGINVMAPALFTLGVGLLLFGLAPRIAAPLLYAMVLWSFLVEIIGTNITANHWLLDTAMLSHIGPVPAASLNWTAMGSLVGLGLLAGVAGVVAFARRDLASD